MKRQPNTKKQRAFNLAVFVAIMLVNVAVFGWWLHRETGYFLYNGPGKCQADGCFLYFAERAGKGVPTIRVSVSPTFYWQTQIWSFFIVLQGAYWLYLRRE